MSSEHICEIIQFLRLRHYFYTFSLQLKNGFCNKTRLSQQQEAKTLGLINSMDLFFASRLHEDRLFNLTVYIIPIKMTLIRV